MENHITISPEDWKVISDLLESDLEPNAKLLHARIQNSVIESRKTKVSLADALIQMHEFTTGLPEHRELVKQLKVMKAVMNDSDFQREAKILTNALHHQNRGVETIDT